MNNQSSSSSGGSLWGTLVSLLIGYLVGNWLAPDIFSMNVGETEWDNIWVYVYMIFWFFALIIHFVKFAFWFFVAVIAVFFGMWLYSRN